MPKYLKMINMRVLSKIVAFFLDQEIPSQLKMWFKSKQNLCSIT